MPACAEEALAELAARAAALSAASGGNLLECFAAVPDPRDPRGIRHSLPCVLALWTAAVLCGNTAIEDVTAWVHAAPQEVLAAAGPGWLPAIAADGKAVRGAAGEDGLISYLLAAATAAVEPSPWPALGGGGG